MGEGGTMEDRFSEALQVISKTKGELKDYTYLALLITESKKRILTNESYVNSGIRSFVETHLDPDQSPPQLASLALQFTAVGVANLDNLEDTLAVLFRNLEKISCNPDSSINSAFYQLIIVIHERSKKSAKLCDKFLQLVSNRCVTDAIIRTLTGSTSYHVVKLATRCFHLALTELTVTNDQCVAQEHVNYDKLRRNLLLQYFDNSTDRKALLSQLRSFLKAPAPGDLKKLMADFIASKLDFSFLSAGIKDFCVVMLEVAVVLNDNKLLEKLVDIQEEDTKLTLIYEVLKSLDRDRRLIKIVTGYLSEIATTPRFTKFLSKPNTAECLVNYPSLQTHVVDVCKQRLDNADLTDDSSVKEVISVLRFLTSMYKMTNLTGDASILKFSSAVLSRFLGVPDNVKLSCCDVLTVLIANMKDNPPGDIGLVAVLGYCAVSGSSSWQLKDSSIQALSAYIQNTSLICSEKDLCIIDNVIKHAHADRMNFIRSASYKLLSHYVTVSVSDANKEEEIVSRVEATILTDQEAIVRRDCVDFLSVWVDRCSRQMLQRLSNLMLHVVSRDFDWEVKLKSARFWEQLLRRSSTTEADELGFLVEQGLFSALILGLGDYEVPVRKAFRAAEDAVRTHLDLMQQSTAKMKKMDLDGNPTCSLSRDSEFTPQFEEEDVDEIIEDIVVSEDTDLLAELRSSALDPDSEVADVPRRSLEDFLLFSRQRSVGLEQRDGEGEDVLKSLLEDIINSTEDIGLVEVIDCY